MESEEPRFDVTIMEKGSGDHVRISRPAWSEKVFLSVKEEGSIRCVELGKDEVARLALLLGEQFFELCREEELPF